MNCLYYQTELHDFWNAKFQFQHLLMCFFYDYLIHALLEINIKIIVRNKIFAKHLNVKKMYFCYVDSAMLLIKNKFILSKISFCE